MFPQGFPHPENGGETNKNKIMMNHAVILSEYGRDSVKLLKLIKTDNYEIY
jgi:hypothetical protein